MAISCRKSNASWPKKYNKIKNILEAYLGGIYQIVFDLSVRNVPSTCISMLTLSFPIFAFNMVFIKVQSFLYLFFLISAAFKKHLGFFNPS